jgi:hypothetical protein
LCVKWLCVCLCALAPMTGALLTRSWFRSLLVPRVLLMHRRWRALATLRATLAGQASLPRCTTLSWAPCCWATRSSTGTSVCWAPALRTPALVHASLSRRPTAGDRARDRGGHGAGGRQGSEAAGDPGAPLRAGRVFVGPCMVLSGKGAMPGGGGAQGRTCSCLGATTCLCTLSWSLCALWFISHKHGRGRVAARVVRRFGVARRGAGGCLHAGGGGRREPASRQAMVEYRPSPTPAVPSASSPARPAPPHLGGDHPVCAYHPPTDTRGAAGVQMCPTCHRPLAGDPSSASPQPQPPSPQRTVPSVRAARKPTSSAFRVQACACPDVACMRWRGGTGRTMSGATFGGWQRRRRGPQ